MKELDQLVENFLQPKPKKLGLDNLLETIEEAMASNTLEEAYFYGDEGQRPIQLKKVVKDIAKYIRRNFPDEARDMTLKQGTYTLEFTGLGDLKTRDMIVRDLADKGFLKNARVKRAALYDTADTNFVFRTKDGKRQRPVIVRFYHGGEGAQTSGAKYELEIADQLNNFFKNSDPPKNYKAEVTGKYTTEPDIVVKPTDTDDESQFVRIETKTKLGSDFGQFTVFWNEKDNKFDMSKEKKQDPVFQRVFDNYIDKLDFPDGQPSRDKSMDIARVPVDNIGTLIGDYYRNKNVQYAIVNDMIYSLDNKELDNNIKAGDVRFRVKNHGKHFSYMVSLKPKILNTGANFLDPQVLNKIFP